MKKLSAKVIILSILAIPILGVAFIASWLLFIFNGRYLYGYVDKTGHFAIAPRFEMAGMFQNGQAQVMVLQNNDDSCVVPTYTFMIDKQGNQIGPKEAGVDHCDDKSYKHSLDRNPISSLVDEHIWPHKDESNIRPRKTGYIFVPGKSLAQGYKWIIPPKFSKAYPFVDNAAWVQVHKDHEEHYGLINKKGEYILPPKCTDVVDFSEGLAACRVAVYFGKFY